MQKEAQAEQEPTGTRLRAGTLPHVLYWIVPSLLCLALYWFGFRAWFQKDDFAWLALHLHVHDFGSFLTAMFTPLAQGTIRPWSERLFFLTGWWLFGLEPLPFRAMAFVTMFANLALLTSVARRLTGSALAGFLAPILWIGNGNLYIPMSWTSAYNQILCSFFLLLALSFWMRYTETGRRRLLAAQWTAFLLGFGALEINVVYPALAALYALCFARGYVRQTVPMFAVSGVYAVVHRSVAPDPASDIYRMYFDAGILDTLRNYVTWSFGADRYAAFRGLNLWPFYAAEALVAAGLLCFSVAMIRRRNLLPVFCAGWFLIAIAPVLPLRNHITDYYLTIPLIGLAILAADALARGWRGGVPLRSVSALLLLLYFVPSAWMARGMTFEYYRASRRAATFVGSVGFAQQRHPGEMLLLRGVDAELFGLAAWDQSFRLLGDRRVFVDSPPAPDTPQRFVLSQSVAVEALRRKRLQVYEIVEGARLRNITLIAKAQLERSPLRLARYLDLRDDLSSGHLGEGWWQSEPHHRWMAKRAVLRLAAPEKPGSRLVLRGACPLNANGPIRMTVTVNGHAYPPSLITTPNPGFEFDYPLRADAVGKAPLVIGIEVDRTVRQGSDLRDLGLAFGTAEIVP